MDKKKKRELLEWVVLIVVIGIIYLGGWHTQIIGRLQQAVLYTGLIKPSELEESKKGSYNFSLRDPEGNRVGFESFKNKVVFVNFWATWCPPCIAEMPDINDLYKKTSDSIQFVMISLDKSEQKAIEFIQEKEFEFPIYFLDSRLPETYNISSIPTTYVLSKTGNITIENKGMAKYNSKSFRAHLSSLLKSK